MHRIFIVCTYIIFITACKQHSKPTINTSAEYFSNNEDNFVFIVFDKDKVDTFFKEYLPIQSSTAKINSGFKQLLLEKEVVHNDSDRYSRQTHIPTHNDYSLALKLLKEAAEKNNDKYFSGSLRYLFYYNCLPTEFNYKWCQLLGGFNFNITFFRLLREKSKIFDGTIYGTAGYHDENIRKIFPDDIYNEITAAVALQIKKDINNSTAFNDLRFQQDKNNFVYFLDQVIRNKCRLFLFDYN